MWFRFTTDESKQAFLSASTLGEITITPSIDWEAFAKEWVAIGQENSQDTGGEVDELADVFGNWGKSSTAQGEELMTD